MKYFLPVLFFLVCAASLVGIMPSFEPPFPLTLLLYAAVFIALFFIRKYADRTGERTAVRLHYLVFTACLLISSASGGFESPIFWLGLAVTASIAAYGRYLMPAVLLVALFLSPVRHLSEATQRELFLFIICAACLGLGYFLSLKKPSERVERRGQETTPANDSRNFRQAAVSLLETTMEAFR
ncbi:MAG TPA: hypothetical protein P5511_06880, partial [Candidatus Goldiibacteriota bacterium]|nr:hypothetical protein [Candidatus Goldiibacteriota bacterium]